VTGGLGPTKDDITREVISEFSGIGLTENREVIAHLEDRFSVKPGELRDNIRRQGLTPVNGTYLPNPHGTAVGLIFETKNRMIAVLPGPPGELRPMLSERLAPLLTDRYGTRTPDSTLQMRFVGIGESSIDKTIRDHLHPPEELEVSSLFEAGRVDLTFSLPGSGPETMSQLRLLERRLQEQIGEYMYSDNGATLEEHVLELLVGREVTIGIAEVGTGGAVAASLNGLANSTKAFKGAISAPSEEQMARIIQLSDTSTLPGEGMRRLCEIFDSKWSLLVSEPVVTQDGSRSVEILISRAEDVLAKRNLTLRGRGETARSWLVSGTLDFLRRELGRN
jgi:nicotinamide-nucleotide amidase